MQQGAGENPGPRFDRLALEASPTGTRTGRASLLRPERSHSASGPSPMKVDGSQPSPLTSKAVPSLWGKAPPAESRGIEDGVCARPRPSGGEVASRAAPESHDAHRVMDQVARVMLSMCVVRVE